MCQDHKNPCAGGQPEGDVPLDVDGGELGDGLSGFVILRFSREFEPGDNRELRELAEELKLDALGEFWTRSDGHRRGA